MLLVRGDPPSQIFASGLCVDFVVDQQVLWDDGCPPVIKLLLDDVVYSVNFLELKKQLRWVTVALVLSVVIRHGHLIKFLFFLSFICVEAS